MKLRNNPHLLVKGLNNQLKSGLIKKLPIYYETLKLNPMAPSPLRNVVPEEIGQFQPLKQTESKDSIYTRKSLAKRSPIYIKTAPTIHYPEGF